MKSIFRRETADMLNERAVNRRNKVKNRYSMLQTDYAIGRSESPSSKLTTKFIPIVQRRNDHVSQSLQAKKRPGPSQTSMSFYRNSIANSTTNYDGLVTFRSRPKNRNSAFMTLDPESVNSVLEESMNLGRRSCESNGSGGHRSQSRKTTRKILNRLNEDESATDYITRPQSRTKMKKSFRQRQHFSRIVVRQQKRHSLATVQRSLLEPQDEIKPSKKREQYIQEIDENNWMNAASRIEQPKEIIIKNSLNKFENDPGSQAINRRSSSLESPAVDKQRDLQQYESKPVSRDSNTLGQNLSRNQVFLETIGVKRDDVRYSHQLSLFSQGNNSQSVSEDGSHLVMSGATLDMRESLSNPGSQISSPSRLKKKLGAHMVEKVKEQLANNNLQNMKRKYQDLLQFHPENQISPRKTRLSSEQRVSTRQACDWIDKRILHAKYTKMKERRRFQDAGLFKEDEELAMKELDPGIKMKQKGRGTQLKEIAIKEQLQSRIANAFRKNIKLAYMPPTEDRQRLRTSIRLQTAIEKKAKVLDDLSQTKPSIDSPEKALQLLKQISDKSPQKDLKVQLKKTSKPTQLFLGQLVEVEQQKFDANAARKKVKVELSGLQKQKQDLDQKCWNILSNKILNIMRQKQGKAPKQIMKQFNLKSTKGKITHDCPLTIGIFKFQRAVRKCYPEKKSMLYYVKQVVLQNKLKKRRMPEKNRLQRLVQKHFIDDQTKFFDINYTRAYAAMLKVFRVIFKHPEYDDQFHDHCLNIGEKYSPEFNENIWSNEFLKQIGDVNKFLDQFTQDIQEKIEEQKRKKRTHMKRQPIRLNKDEKLMYNFDSLFDTEINRTRAVFEHGKLADSQKFDSKDNEERTANVNFYVNCSRKAELPLPTFAKFENKQLILTQYRITEMMASELSVYLAGVKQPSRYIHQLLIDDCGMTDSMLAMILQGLRKQSQKLKSITYVNNDIGPKSFFEIKKIIPQLEEIVITNVKKEVSPVVIQQFLNNVVKDGMRLQKLRLSRLCLNQMPMVESLKKITTQSKFLTHLDISWTKLTTVQFYEYAQCLVSEYNTAHHKLRNTGFVARNFIPLRSLNLGYVTLNQDKSNLKDYEATEQLVKIMVEFLQGNFLLSHVDLSGMNFSNDQLVQVATAAGYSQSLCSVHLNDNGIRKDDDLRFDVLDCFGINQDVSEPQFQINKPVKNPNVLRKIVAQQRNICMTKIDIDEDDRLIDPLTYKKHLIHARQSKKVQKGKLTNNATTKAGVGRLTNSMLDQFVVTRKINQPELIFNQNVNKDAYFDMDASENWQLQTENNPMTECHITHKHKYTMIFYEQGNQINSDLQEVTDPEVVERVKDSLNITFKERKEIAPFICGSIVSGGYARKLRMLRCDLFMMLSVCQSAAFITKLKQSRAIRRGIIEMIKKGQDINVKDDCLQFFTGWDKQAILDKCKFNETMEVQLVNFPEHWEARKNAQAVPGCLSYVYAAYLPPGLHQFLIYCPKTGRLFVKDIVVDLNKTYLFPEYPHKPKEDMKKISKNVWRKWRQDSKVDIEMALLSDMVEVSYDPKLFLENEDDIEQCRNILTAWFEKLQTCHVMNLANSFNEDREQNTYPEVNQQTLIDSIMSAQTNQEEMELLPRSKVELAYIKATRNDETNQMSGTLCRGEYLELLMRLAWERFGQPKMLGPFLQQFLEIYIEPVYQASNIVPLRKIIRNSSRLNDLLHDNRACISAFYEDLKTGVYFDFASAQKFFNPLTSQDDEDLVSDLRACFVYSKMTNQRDLEESSRYLRLEYVEFLEMICRVARSFWDDRRARLVMKKSHVNQIKDGIEYEVEYILERRYEIHRKSQLGKEESEKKEIPAFLCLDDAEDSEY